MATVTAPTQQNVLIRLFLSSSVLDIYRREAREYGVEIEEILASRLTECVEYNASKPLYFSDKERQDLETVLGRNVGNPNSVIEILKRFLGVKLNGIPVTLPPLVLERLRTRCPRGADFAEWMQKRVVEFCEREVGLR